MINKNINFKIIINIFYQVIIYKTNKYIFIESINY